MKTNKQIEADVQRLCGLTAEQYCSVVEQAGNDYALAYVGGDHECKRWLTHSKVYWAWFKSQWLLVDRLFVMSYCIADGTPDVVASLRLMWADEHAAECRKLYLPRHVVQDFRNTMMAERATFSQMVDDMIKSINTHTQNA